MTIGPEFPQVLEAARAGADWAWRVIYKDLAPSVLGYLALRSDSPEDICGDVFSELVRELPRFKGAEPAFRAWVFLIARHRLIDDRRRRSRRPEVPAPVDAISDTAAPDQVEEEVLGRRATQELRRVLDRLPQAQRDVVLLRVVAGLSVDEVAQVVGRRPGAVRALQHRAIRTLRRNLGARNAIGSLDGS